MSNNMPLNCNNTFILTAKKESKTIDKAVVTLLRPRKTCKVELNFKL